MRNSHVGHFTICVRTCNGAISCLGAYEFGYGLNITIGNLSLSTSSTSLTYLAHHHFLAGKRAEFAPDESRPDLLRHNQEARDDLSLMRIGSSLVVLEISSTRVRNTSIRLVTVSIPALRSASASPAISTNDMQESTHEET